MKDYDASWDALDDLTEAIRLYWNTCPLTIETKLETKQSDNKEETK